MVNEAQANADKDREAKDMAEARNQLDSLKAQANRVLTEATSASDDAKKPVQDAINDADSALNSNADKSRLEQISQDLAQKLQAFQQANAAQGAEAGAAPGAGADDDEDVIDADFKPAG